MNPQNHFNTFSIKNDTNANTYAVKPEKNIYGTSILTKNVNNNMNMSQMNNNVSKFKSRKNHEKENRRMAIELVK